MKKQDIVEKMRRLALPKDMYWLTAGSGIVVHGLREETGDIDLGCTSQLAEILIQQGANWQYLADGTRRICISEDIEAFENWFVDEIIQLDGLSVASLPSIRKQKIALNRKKDEADIRLIDEFLRKI